MAKIYTFKENDITLSGEKHHLIDLAKHLREVGIEGTWSDLVYQIEYEFDIDGVRIINDYSFDELYDENTWNEAIDFGGIHSSDTKEHYADLLMEQQEQM